MAKPKTIDEYIARTEGTFAHPILTRVHEIVLETVPKVAEAIKWGAPSYEYNGLMMSTLKFKKFAAVWFHRGAFFDDPKNLLEASSDDTKYMRKYILRSIDELDEDGLKGLIREAIRYQESDAELVVPNKSVKEELYSDLLEEALSKDSKAKAEFENFTDYKKKEFIEYIETAKRDTTKQRRLKKSMDLIRKGVGLNEMYK
ncbi:DUF1801 domain-containing protein [Rhodohalobacter sulfatireducens]|uniref:DUF1801 domain-containing protein n=1 Tax=Rhodohalobacter sulfatireducens TaxID=2911366 RepID=A0ABS9KDP3_9BACT|nr:DUF1801 domain-containing protein [Rhodohalobacter sulfatireducens]MCG2588989.1 DUF1801 domain-containing protein [Rhodohalobacter sulfatireducens]